MCGAAEERGGLERLLVKLVLVLHHEVVKDWAEERAEVQLGLLVSGLVGASR